MSPINHFVVLCLSLAAPIFAAKSKCDAKNNLMRCFASSSQLASPYCSSFLSIPLSTVIQTATSTTYLTIPTTVSTETDVEVSTMVVTSNPVVLVTETQTITTTLVSKAAPVGGARKREPKNPKPSPTGLACIGDLKPAEASASIAFACSCLSVTPLKTTVTSTVSVVATAFSSLTSTTTTTTVTQVVTVIPSTTFSTEIALQTDVTNCFGITIDSASDSSLVGQVLALTSSDYDPQVGQLSHFTDVTQAETFYLSSTNALVSGLAGPYAGKTAGIAPGVSAFYIQFTDAVKKSGYGLVDLVCSIDSSNLLSCTDASGKGDNILEYCADLENHLLIANFVYDSTCVPVTLRAVPKSCNGVF